MTPASSPPQPRSDDINENLTWAWLAAGLIPYYIKKRYPSRRERLVTIRALFWTLEVHTRWLRPTRRGRRSRRCTDWTLRIPLIERVRVRCGPRCCGSRAVSSRRPSEARLPSLPAATGREG